MEESFQEQCNAILDNKSLFEEDQVDMLEELVIKKYGTNLPSNKIEKIILDIMWKHKDPTKAIKPKTEIVGVEEIQTKVDIPSFERRLELQKQLLTLEALNEAERNKRIQNRPSNGKSKIDQEYNELLKKRNELYDDSNKITTASETELSPIDQIYDMFDKTVRKTTIEQALKTTGYNLVEAASLIMFKLKSDNVQTQERTPPAESSPVLNQTTNTSEATPNHYDPSLVSYKAPCSFLIKTGSCLRSDCPFNHDLKKVTCTYWLKGNCFNGDSCQFKHGLDEIKSLNPTPNTTTTSTTSKFNPNSVTTFVPSSSTFNPSAATSFIPSQSERPKIVLRKPLRKPKFTPWGDTSHCPFFKTYLTHKTASFKFESQRKKFAQSSTEAWRNNNSHEAKKLSEKANKFENKYINELKLADEALGEYSETCNDEIWYEMYGLEFSEATDELAENIEVIKSKYKKGEKTMYLIVPPMVDGYGFKRITKPITFWLESNLYRFIVFNQGSASNIGDLIAVDPWTV